MTIARGRGDYALMRARRWARKPLDVLDNAGEQMSFYSRAIAWTPRTLRRYRKEMLRLLAEVTFGSGALAVIGGTIGVIVMMSGFTGVVVGSRASRPSTSWAAPSSPASCRRTSTPARSPRSSRRWRSPPRWVVASPPSSARCGSRGDRRSRGDGCSSVPFLVTTRMIAGFVAVIPLYIVGLLAAYLASRVVSTVFNGQSSGSYDHYFNLFLPPEDVLWSFGKVLVFAFVLILIHCYYGFHARGGPAGVGVAVGHAVRTAIVTIAVLDFFLSLAIWGTTTTVRVAG